MTETIFARASGSGRAGVAVIRVSGPRAKAVLETLTGREAPAARQAVVRALQDGAGRVIDQALVLWFEGPASFTGEDSLELHTHGGPAVLEAVFSALGALECRPAAPGEFSRRAFANGKMDLTEVEGLADLVDAETEAQRVQALAQMTGSLRGVYAGWRDQLVHALAALEGEIDFPDEDDVPDDLAHAARAPLEQLVAEMETHLDEGKRGERVRDGFVVALIGEPNAGKSSVLNRLARREAAIVTDIPGTTRDVVEVRLVLGGFAVIVADTAGLRDAEDSVEAEGVRRALARADNADLRLAVVDVSRETLPEAVGRQLRHGDGVIWNKADLGGVASPVPANTTSLRVSTKTGEGLSDLEAWLTATVTERLGTQDAPALSRARHRIAVEAGLDHVRRALQRLSDAPELASAEIHLALRRVESLTGRVDVEDVLDAVFSQFCIGK